MNNWNITGRLGKDCEVKQGQNGNRLVFSVAVKSGFGDNEKTTWANCVVFGKRADGQLPQYLKKGQEVAVSAEVTLEKWNDQNGLEKQALKLVVGSLDLIGGQPQQQAPQQYQQPAQQPPVNQQQPNPRAQPQQAQQAPNGFEDDCPFANPYKSIYYAVS